MELGPHLQGDVPGPVFELRFIAKIILHGILQSTDTGVDAAPQPKSPDDRDRLRASSGLWLPRVAHWLLRCARLATSAEGSERAVHEVEPVLTPVELAGGHECG